MLQVKNKSQFKVHITVVPDKEGVDTLLIAVKGTFAIGEKVTIHPSQVAVAPADVYYGDPDSSSIKTPSDVSLPKPAVDFLLLGHAYTPGGQATQVDVSMRLGTGVKKIRAVGNRTWGSGIFGSKASPPQPFDKIPLTWECAFGGINVHPKSPEKKKSEERNPAGKGFHHFGPPKEGTPLPNLEPLHDAYRSWKDRPDPVCFAPIAGGWLPRRTFAGTYDQAWQDSRAPYLPKDFDPKFLQIAPPDQIIPGLVGGEPVEILNASPNGRLSFALPAYAIEAQVSLGNSVEKPAMRLDTVLVEPDDKRVILVWRGALPCDKKALQVREVAIIASPRS